MAEEGSIADHMMNMIGIYMIINIRNSKFYIGSTVASFKERFSGHVCELNKNRHGNDHLQNVWNKEKENIIFVPIVETTRQTARLLEQFFIDTLHPQYNIELNVSPKLMSDETKKKISNTLKGRKLSLETRRKMSEARKGKKISESVKKKISDARKGMEFSDEWKKNLSKGQVRRFSNESERTAQSKRCKKRYAEGKSNFLNKKKELSNV